MADTDKTLTNTILTAGEVTAGGSIYPKEVLEKAVREYSEKLLAGGSHGGVEDGLPLSLSKVTHRITDVRMDGDNVIASAVILDTPEGMKIKALLENGGDDRISLSSKGYGRTDENGTIDRFSLDSINISLDPGKASQ